MTEPQPRHTTTCGRASRKLISIVVPAYNESDCVDELARRLTVVMDSEPGYDFEVVIVENGSEDDTWQKLQKIHEADPRFKILQLARNFRMDGGPHSRAGAHHAATPPSS